MKSQKQEEPQREHAVMAMLSLLYMLPEGRERGMMMEAMIAFVFKGWQWNVQKFKEEMDACQKAAETSGAKLSCWFEKDGFKWKLEP